MKDTQVLKTELFGNRMSELAFTFSKANKRDCIEVLTKFQLVESVSKTFLKELSRSICQDSIRTSIGDCIDSARTRIRHRLFDAALDEKHWRSFVGKRAHRLHSQVGRLRLALNVRGQMPLDADLELDRSRRPWPSAGTRGVDPAHAGSESASGIGSIDVRFDYMPIFVVDDMLYWVKNNPLYC